MFTPAQSVIRNSHVISREGDGELFAVVDGITYARLDGYAVIPVETYRALLSARSGPTAPAPSAST